MLNPNDRQLYLNALKPPEEYEFDAGVAATYSLDLLTLLLAPVSFVLSEFQNESEVTLDLTTILESLRRTADKLAVFCQSGRIQIPKADNLLYSHLERAVIEVTPPNPTGVFHPKFWLLRFVSPGRAPVYRFICLSRNLTFDQSWDTILVMEGEVAQNRIRGFTVNRPLADFVNYLPELAINETSPHIRGLVETITGDLPRVKFQPPSSFHAYSFKPIGIPGYRKMNIERNNRLLIISPFLSDRALVNLASTNKKGENILVSRLDNLDALQRDTLDKFNRIYAFEDLAVEPEQEDDYSKQEESPQGLHAKLILAEYGWDAKLWTGSANATDPVFTKQSNIEFMVELEGRRKDMGIDCLLQDEEEAFVKLLTPYVPPAEPRKQELISQRLEQLLEEARRALGRAGLRLTAHSLDKDGSFALVLDQAGPTKLDFLSGLNARCWPITLNKETRAKAIPADTDVNISFEPLSLESITSFIAFELTAQEDSHRKVVRFVLNLPLYGIPENRQEHILYRIISDRGSFIRYLLLLLTEGGSFQPELYTELMRKTGGKASSGGLPALPLFEELVRAMSRHPEKIDRIARLIDDISKTEEGRRALPEGFAEIWEPIIAARKKVMDNG